MQLLKILLAKYRDIRLHHIEEFAYHGGDADKKAGAKLAIENMRDFRDLYPGLLLLRLRIHHLDRRSKQQIDTPAGQLAAVFGHGSRIGLEILPFTKLQRIDKDAGNGAACLFFRFVDQCKMSIMQIPHGRDKSNALTAFAPC